MKNVQSCWWKARGGRKASDPKESIPRDPVVLLWIPRPHDAPGEAGCALAPIGRSDPRDCSRDVASHLRPGSQREELHQEGGKKSEKTAGRLRIKTSGLLPRRRAASTCHAPSRSGGLRGTCTRTLATCLR